MPTRILYASAAWTLLFASSCQSPLGDTVRVDLFVAGDRVLQDVYVLAGDDKQWFPRLAANERGTFQLRFQQPTELAVRFRTGSRQFNWVSPKIDPVRIRLVQLELSDKADPPVKSQLIAR